MKIRKKLIDAGILTAVFIVAVIVSSYLTNRGNNNMTADMGAATYPQVTFSYNGYGLNTLPGYRDKMDITSMRDTVTPVTGQKADIEIQAYDNHITSARYRIYSLDGTEKFKDEKLKNPGTNISIDLSAEGLLREERVLELVLNIDGKKPVYFYTRIADEANSSMAACLEYIRNFHENAIGKVEGVGVGAALEPNDKADNTTFRHVTIHSDYTHVSWGELEPQVEQGERWYVKEMNDSSVSVMLEYRVRCKGEENETDVYNVREFFRVRHIEDMQKTYLLDYDRTMEQVFDPSKIVLNEKGILLGIADPDLQYKVNKDGSIVSFIQADELWNYNKNTDEVSLVFSFASAENTDPRNLTNQYEIEILDVDANGNTTFAVSGYMNRGEHEGETGVAIYYYDIGKSSVDEKIFISSNEFSDRVITGLGETTYYSVGRGFLYVVADGTLYEYDIENDEKKTLTDGLEEAQYAVSEDGRMVAYQKGGGLSEAKKITVMNLETGKTFSVSCEEDECIRPLGFVKNDFVYGVAKTEDTGKTVSGEATVPMYKVEIQNSKKEILKTYQAEGIYVLGAVFEDNMITLNRAVKEGGAYTSVASDYITNNEEKEESNIYLESYATSLKETQMRLTYDDGISDKEPKVLKPKQVLFENPAVVAFQDENSEKEEKYYVYGCGSLQAVCGKAGDAIKKAQDYNGTVVSSSQEYVWERGNQDYLHSISGQDEMIQAISDRLRQKESAVDIMKDINGSSLDLSGCTAEELLYIINRDRPVIGMLDVENAVILVGYNETEIIYIDVASGERRSAPYDQMDQMTQGSGNTYIA